METSFCALDTSNIKNPIPTEMVTKFKKSVTNREKRDYRKPHVKEITPKIMKNNLTTLG